MTDPIRKPLTEAWLAELRQRFVSVTARRVPQAHVEDLVQDALGVVYERGVVAQHGVTREGLPGLAWCFQVLRNTIGNFYQKQKTRSREPAIEDQPMAPPVPTPLEALEESQMVELLRSALEEFQARDAQCGRYLLHLAQGMSPQTLAVEESVEAPVLYRRLYRCRAKFRQLLERKGFLS